MLVKRMLSFSLMRLNDSLKTTAGAVITMKNIKSRLNSYSLSKACVLWRHDVTEKRQKQPVWLAQATSYLKRFKVTHGDPKGPDNLMGTPAGQPAPHRKTLERALPRCGKVAQPRLPPARVFSMVHPHISFMNRQQHLREMPLPLRRTQKLLIRASVKWAVHCTGLHGRRKTRDCHSEVYLPFSAVSASVVQSSRLSQNNFLKIWISRDHLKPRFKELLLGLPHGIFRGLLPRAFFSRI